MSGEPAIPKRFAIARRWEGRARYWLYVPFPFFCVFAFLPPHNFLWPLASVFISMPAYWLFNIRCYRCAWLVYRQFGTARARYAKDQMLAPEYSKMLYHLPDACTKCGAPFIEARLDEAQD